MSEIVSMDFSSDHLHLRPQADTILGLLGNYIFPTDRNALYAEEEGETFGAFVDEGSNARRLVGLSFLRYVSDNEINRPHGLVVALAVDWRYQEKGLGSALLYAAEKSTAEEGLNLIAVPPDQDSTRLGDLGRFFISHGYTKNQAGIYTKEI
ncbi:GNAT family N-acetyltransferase [Candidatus Saccharibacteria bacterium]|nr:MAG: GNAT family N-acetyltransferase [Candidatus Saccharibacteria bacterium]